jgi:hypothetical protein
MEAVRTSETSVDNQFTRQYNPEDSSEQYRRYAMQANSQPPFFNFVQYAIPMWRKLRLVR